MGLDEFKSEQKSQYRAYSEHEHNEKLQDIVDQYQKRFPIDLRIQFIEVSSRMTKHAAMAYKRDGKKYYIRVSENFIERSNDEQLHRTVIHEMVHVYMYQIGMDNENHGKYFRWVLGRVGGSFTGETIHNTKWEKCVQPFIEKSDL